ncbi:MAG: hypothetical protein FJZ63_05470 [Chlamydiae bacterium]|nr:hypothetical protein [Chlamydiota bacterium]
MSTRNLSESPSTEASLSSISIESSTSPTKRKLHEYLPDNTTQDNSAKKLAAIKAITPADEIENLDPTGERRKRLLSPRNLPAETRGIEDLTPINPRAAVKFYI